MAYVHLRYPPFPKGGTSSEGGVCQVGVREGGGTSSEGGMLHGTLDWGISLLWSGVGLGEVEGPGKGSIPLLKGA